MSPPPIRGKVVQGPPGRTRAEAAQKLLVPQKKMISQTALQRATLANKAHALGVPLTNQVKAHGTTRLRQRSSTLANYSPHLVGVGFAAMAALLLVAGLEILFVLAAACVFYGCGFAVGKHLQERRFAALLADEIDLASEFDQLVDRIAARLPAETLEELHAIKGSLTHLLPKLVAIQSEGSLGQEDLFFIQQTIVRYLPDASAPYFAIPVDQQDSPLLEQGKTPKQVLREQFQMIRDKLRELEERIVRADAQKLAQHKRFLERKTSV